MKRVHNKPFPFDDSIPILTKKRKIEINSKSNNISNNSFNSEIYKKSIIDTNSLSRSFKKKLKL